MDKSIKVLHVADKLGVSGSTVDGVARMLGWWFPLLDREGVDCELLVLGRSGKVIEELRAAGIRVHALNRHPLDPRAFIEFGRVVESLRPDLLHVHNWRATTFALLQKKSTGVPVIVHEHADRPKVPLIQRLADRALNRDVDKVLAVSHAVAAMSVEVRRFPEEKVEVILNAVPPPDKLVEDKSAVAQQVRQELNIPADADLVGYVGRLADEKGPQVLVEAFARVATQRNNAFLAIVGDGPLENSLCERINELGIAERCRILGYRNDVERLSCSFTIQVVPSLSEGFGLTALEAMQNRVAAICTDIEGLEEIVEDGVNALIVPAGDIGRTAKAIQTLLDDQSLRKRLIRAGSSRAIDFDLEARVGEIVGVYSDLLRGRDS